jgi:YD repeat-containing protein
VGESSGQLSRVARRHARMLASHCQIAAVRNDTTAGIPAPRSCTDPARPGIIAAVVLSQPVSTPNASWYRRLRRVGDGTLAAVVFLGLACCGGKRGSDQGSPAVATNPPAPTTTSHVLEACPDAVTFGVSANLWNHELFPGCQPAPFHTYGVACSTACPMPCRERTRSDDFTSESTFTYRDGGIAAVEHIIHGLTGEYRRTERCTYQAGKLASCVDIDGNPVTLVRDASGRISEIRYEEHNKLAVTYDPRGRVSVLDFTNEPGTYLRHVELTWDDTGGLRSERATRSGGSGRETAPTTRTIDYRYDDRGRLVHITMGEQTIAYSDATGMVQSTRQTYFDGRDKKTAITTFEYDAHGRPTRIADAEVVREYDYECWPASTTSPPAAATGDAPLR